MSLETPSGQTGNRWLSEAGGPGPGRGGAELAELVQSGWTVLLRKSYTAQRIGKGYPIAWALPRWRVKPGVSLPVSSPGQSIPLLSKNRGARLHTPNSRGGVRHASERPWFGSAFRWFRMERGPPALQSLTGSPEMDSPSSTWSARPNGGRPSGRLAGF